MQCHAIGEKHDGTNSAQKSCAYCPAGNSATAKAYCPKGNSRSRRRIAEAIGGAQIIYAAMLPKTSDLHDERRMPINVLLYCVILQNSRMRQTAFCPAASDDCGEGEALPSGETGGAAPEGGAQRVGVFAVGLAYAFERAFAEAECSRIGANIVDLQRFGHGIASEKQETVMLIPRYLFERSQAVFFGFERFFFVGCGTVGGGSGGCTDVLRGRRCGRVRLRAARLRDEFASSFAGAEA